MSTWEIHRTSRPSALVTAQHWTVTEGLLVFYNKGELPGEKHTIRAFAAGTWDDFILVPDPAG